MRPGKGTEEYVSRLLMRLSTVGSVFLGLVALLPIIAQMVLELAAINRFRWNKFIDRYRGSFGYCEAVRRTYAETEIYWFYQLKVIEVLRSSSTLFKKFTGGIRMNPHFNGTTWCR